LLKSFATAALLALSMTGAAAEVAEPATELPNVHQGDKWVYQTTDDITGEKKPEISFVVTELNDTQIFVRATKTGAPGTQFIVYDKNWNLLSDDVWRKIPNDGTGVRPPLSVGQEWRSKMQAQNLKTGSNFSDTTKSKIVGEEKVVTKAGTFDAFKTVMEIERVPIADPARHTEFTLTIWYAPAANRYIKRSVVQKQGGHLRDSSTQELVQYSPK
jgi:hypothetical protein